MGEVGRWDAELFDRFAEAAARPRPFTRADDARYRALLGELARIHDPLALFMLPQGERLVLGAERLPHAEKVAAARVALVRALSDLDPSQSALSGWFRWKLRDELQRAVQESAIVMRGRRRPLAEVLYVDDVGEFATGLYEEPFAEPLPCAPCEVREVRAKPGAALRRAIDVFLDDHCRFAASARAAATAVMGRYERLAHHRREPVVRGELLRALRARGVKSTSLRVPWASTPVRGFAGLCLQRDTNGGAENARIRG